MNEIKNSFPKNPFENIGFAISGDGYRAEAYGLGVVSLLNKIELESNATLLQKVSFLSSTSGGTITATFYAASVKKGFTLKPFFRCWMKS